MANDRVVELEGAGHSVERNVRALDVHEDVVGLVNLVDRVGELASSPVFEPVDGASVRFDHRTVPLDHRRDLLALVRMDHEHHFVVPHRSLLSGLPPERAGPVRQGVDGPPGGHVAGRRRMVWNSCGPFNGDLGTASGRQQRAARIAAAPAGPPGERWRTASKRQTAAAAETFRLSTGP